MMIQIENRKTAAMPTNEHGFEGLSKREHAALAFALKWANRPDTAKNRARMAVEAADALFDELERRKSAPKPEIEVSVENK